MITNGEFANKVKSNPALIQKMTDFMNQSDLINQSTVLRKERKRNTIIIMVIFALLGLGLGLFFGIAGESAFAGIIVGIICLVIGLIGVAIVFSSAKKKYTSKIAPSVIEALYGPKAVYQPNGGYDPDYLRGLNVFRVRSLNQWEFIQGHYFNIPFSISNVESYHYETRGSGKNSHQEKVTDFYGSVMSFKMNKPSKSVIEVTEGMSLFSGKSINFESSAFNKKFNVYCENRENAFYIITPQLQLAMIDIEKSVPGAITMLFRGEELVVVIASNITRFDKADLNETDNHNINAIIDSILAPALIIEDMNLDHKFFIDESDLKKNEEKEKENKEDIEDKDAVLKGVTASQAGVVLNEEEKKEIDKIIDRKE